MTREEIALFLDLDESFTSGQLEECFSRKLAEIRQELAQAGSKPARAIARTRLDRFVKNEAEIMSFVERARALEEATLQLTKAEEYLKNGKARLASVPLGRLHEIRRDLLPPELQDRIDEIGVILEEESQKAELAAREAERVAREAEEKARREELAERARIEAEERARHAEEEARLAAQRAAEKAAMEAAEAELRAAEEAARKEAEERAAEEAAKKTRAEAEERARFEELERVAREKEARQQAEKTYAEEAGAHLLETKAQVDTLVFQGEYDAAATLLTDQLKGPDSPSERAAWEASQRDGLMETAAQFATARLDEARAAQKAGYRAAAAKLADVVLTIAPFLPTKNELEAECALLRAVTAAPPAASPCSCLTIEYSRADSGKRRLHVLTGMSATFGRSVNADVVVRVMASMGDAEKINRLIGRCHFIVENTGSFVNIIDGSRAENGTIKASTNGVFIDGKRVVYPRSIEGRGEMLHIASQQLASHVAHWSLRLVNGDPASIPDAVRQLRPEGKWPQMSGLFMARKDDMPEDVLFVWEAVPLSIVDAKLARYWLVRSGDGLLVWDGTSARDVVNCGVLDVLSTGKLSHIGG